MKYPVAIVDDHSLFSQALENLVNGFEHFQVVFQAKNGAELIKKLENKHLQKPQVILLDINMPVMNGIETMEWLKKHYPNTKVLALSMIDDEQMILKMLKAGAKGYLLKDISPDVLQLALDEVIEKGHFYSEKITDTLMKSLVGNNKNVKQLKDREIDFLKLACTEMTYKEIASKMCLSPKTIDGYRESLFEKLNVKSRTGLVLYAIKNNLYQLQ